MTESVLTQEIQNLKLKLEQLEQLKIEQDENKRKNNFNDNLLIIKKAYESRRINGAGYSKRYSASQAIDRAMVEPLEAIHNVLNNLNERLINLEMNLQQQ